MKTLITNGTVITPTEELADGWVLVDGDRIAAVGQGAAPAADATRDAAGCTIAPGFIDLHAQGFRGYDLWDPSDEAFLGATGQMASTGVTACQASCRATDEVCRTMRPRIGRSDGGCRVVGLYFEVPFISPDKRGAIGPEYVEQPSRGAAERILEMSRGVLSMITIAPEQPGALDLIPPFRAARGPAGPVVCALGHTSATYEEAVAGFDAGITHSTHLFNAMTGLHHRDPGAVGALLTRPDVSVEIICDGVHLHPAAVRVAVACKGAGKACLITDCVSGLGREIVDGAPRLADGTLAGSVLSMDRAVANVQRFAGVSLREAVEMATLSPARVIGLDASKGSLEPGKDADISIFDDEVRVLLAMVGGDVVFQAEE